MTHPKVDAYLQKSSQWQEEIKALREILLDCGLQEEWKWYTPCYTYLGNNIILIYQFKTYMGIGFFQGALLKDPLGLLEKQGVNTRAVRLIKFQNVDKIRLLHKDIKNYILEAIEIEKQGLQYVDTTDEASLYPEELKLKIDEDATFKKAFEALTPGRRRAYSIYFSGAKQPKTRQARIEAATSRILQGKGMNDK